MSPSIKPRSLSQARDVLQRLRWFNCVVIFLSPLLALYGVLSAPSAPHRSTLVFAWTYYVFNMLGASVSSLSHSDELTRDVPNLQVLPPGTTDFGHTGPTPPIPS